MIIHFFSLSINSTVCLLPRFASVCWDGTVDYIDVCPSDSPNDAWEMYFGEVKPATHQANLNLRTREPDTTNLFLSSHRVFISSIQCVRIYISCCKMYKNWVPRSAKRYNDAKVPTKFVTSVSHSSIWIPQYPPLIPQCNCRDLCLTKRHNPAVFFYAALVLVEDCIWRSSLICEPNRMLLFGRSNKKRETG